MANAIWTRAERDLAKAGQVYWRYICEDSGWRKKCHDLDQVKSGHGVLVFDWPAHLEHNRIKGTE